MNKNELIKKLTNEILEVESKNNKIIYSSYYKTAPWIGSKIVWREATESYFVLITNKELIIYSFDINLRVLNKVCVKFDEVKRYYISNSPQGIDTSDETLTMELSNGRIFDFVKSKYGDELKILSSYLSSLNIEIGKKNKDYLYMKYAYGAFWALAALVIIGKIL